MFRALALFAAAAAPSAAQAQISVVRSSASGEKWAPQPSLTWRAATPSSGANVTISRAQKQTLHGFGAAFTDTSAYNAMVLMNESSRREFVDAHWGPRGLGFALGRVHINSPDYAFASYNLDNVSGDWSLGHFDAGMAYDSQRVLPLMRLAQAAAGAPLRLFGSPWSPPAWMKKPCQCCHDMICSAAAPCLLDDAGGHSARATWAAYIVKWLDAMAAHGFRMWGLTPQNEPEAIQQKFESCAFAPADMADFIGGYLGPALADQWADLHVMGYDHNRLHALTWAQALLGNTSVAKYVDSFAVHWYDYGQSLGLDNVAAIRQLLGPDAPFLNTESCYLQSLVIDWRIGELYMADIFGSLNFGLGGWMGWNLVLLTGDRYPQWLGGPNHDGTKTFGDAVLLELNASGTERLIYQASYYILGHVSRFARPGARLLPSGGRGVAASAADYDDVRAYALGQAASTDLLLAVAFAAEDGRTLSAVVANPTEADAAFDLIDAGAQGGARAATTTLPPHTIATYSWAA